ncbi:MAG: GGDEF domain-containing protein [Proteobacteria bacterium]|nr:GGDEF domain-containing protein [Pseudomonadota bacterium]
MTVLEYTIHGIRRGFRVTWSFVFAGAFAAAIVAGLFSDVATSGARKAAAICMFGVWAAAFGVNVHRRLAGSGRTAATSWRADLELGLLLVVATHALVQISGGLTSPAYPLIFILVAFLVVYTPQWVGFTLVTATIGLELGFVALAGANASLPAAVIHALFIVLFSLLNLVFTRREVSRTRRQAAENLARDRIAVADDARAFRLTVATSEARPASARGEEQERLARCTVGEVRRSMYHHVDLLKRTMGLNTCVLLWLDGCGETLRIFECVSDVTEHIATRKIDRKEGVVGAIIQSRTPLALKGAKPGGASLPYYESPVATTDFLGVPVIEHGAVRGVLCADRVDGRSFGTVDQENLVGAVESILQIVSNERIFAQLERAKTEQTKLLSASELLTKALTLDDVVEAALDASGRLAPFDLAAVALATDRGRLVVRAVRGETVEPLVGVEVADTTGLAGSVLKNRHYLPYRGEFDPSQQIIFTKKAQKAFARMRSALVLPLTAGDEALGALVLATEAPSAYPDDVRTMLQVMINQLGTALQNARMVRRLEELATTDGLTGLPNHRVFQEELDRQLAHSLRFSTETSLILCDVDKFKAVNDTYGHPVGDVVLKGLGETLRRNVVRDTDLPARYGGEEFIVICSGTGTEGAQKLAERIRRDLEGQAFRSEKGEFRCTISMGIATYPAHARSKEELIGRADIALYAAKEGGRNQVRVWQKEMRQKGGA